jgi:PAS domain S-box-containing protein
MFFPNRQGRDMKKTDAAQTRFRMTVVVTDKPNVIRRCPVCKIDRKGRFILANQQAQNLFGLSEVELFGRPFVDFLEATDRPIFLQLVRNRNPYETTFDSVCLRLIDSKGQTIPATLIVSVNFGGGNPANYQVIIRPDEVAADNKITPDEESGWEELARVLLDDTGDFVPQTMASLLHTLTGAAAVAIYDLGLPQCPIVASTGSDAAGLPPLDSAFRWEDDAGAVCGCEATPNEVRATFALAEGNPYLLRMILSSSESGETSGPLRKRAEIAAALIHTVRAPLQRQTTQPSFTESTVSLPAVFDSLGAGLVLLDCRGQVLEHNPTFDSWFSMSDSPSDLRGLLDTIAHQAGGQSAAAIENYLAASATMDDPPCFCGHLTLATGAELDLTITCVGDNPTDRSICFVFRDFNESHPKNEPASGLSLRAGNAAVDLLKSSIAATSGVWQKLEHEHHNDLSRDGGFYLSCMSRHVETLAGTIADLERMLKLVGEVEKPQTVDLQLLVDRMAEELIRTRPTLTFNVPHPDLPKINAPLHKLSAILRDVLTVSAQGDSEKALEIAVTVSLENGLCTISVCDNGPGLNTRQIRSLFRLRRRSPKDLSLTPPGLNVGLGLAFEVVTSLGGSLEVQSHAGRGTSFRITLPLSPP